MSLPTRKIGNDNVTAIGFGLMGLSAFYGAIENDEERFKVLDTAVEEGCTNWDSADIYGDSEDLVGKWFKRTGKRDQIFLATKFGSTPTAPNGKPEYVKSAVEKSLKRLGVETIDLYYLHRADPTITVGAMAELVKEGKVRYLGLSEVTAKTLRRAHAVHPIAAVQIEYSPFFLDIEDEKIGLLKTCRELGVAVVAYSPLGRGMLTGTYKSNDDIPKDDWRRTIPKFSNENFPNILKLVKGLEELGKKHNATAGQVTLAWLLAQGDDIIPIPGTKKIKYLKENLAAAKIKLSPQEIAEVREIANKVDATVGARYPPASMQWVLADTPELQ
ncbi:NADP-dependent oxidoreductase domain-containing protein [Flammula alnicola]|nr:NADP-dependent oxidoreductase domain-containing protein [Flammula alnicola]